MQFKFAEIASLRDEKYSPNTTESLPYIGLEHIAQQTLRLSGVGDSSNVISQKNRFYSGDILFGKLRPYFRKVYRPDFEGVCSTDIWVVRAKEGFDQAYLFYLMASTNFINECNSSSSGTRMPRADWKLLSNTVWDIPSFEKQRLIGQYLSDLDEKIELNLKTNQTLEEIARAVFKEWFIDFNYPGATDEMAESELAPIPRGWKFDKLSGLAVVSSGKGLKRNEFRNEGYPVLGANGQIGLTHNYLLDDEVILTGRVGTLGTLQLLNKKAWVSDNVLIINAKETFYYYYLYFWLKTIDFQNLNRGSTQPLITKTDLLNLQILRPDLKVFIDFDRLCRGMFDLIENNINEIGMLSDIRDLLLPKLMNGDINQ